MAAPSGAQPIRPRPCDGTEGVRVAVTGIGAFDVVNPGLGAARALRNAPGIAAVYGFGYGALEAGIYQPNLFNACFRLPAADSPALLLERLAEIYARHPFDVLMPCMDQELPRFIAIQQRLRDLGIAMLLPSKNALDSRAKIALFSGKLPADWGAFCIPESRIVRSEAEAVRAAMCIGMPCAIKGPLARCFIARSFDQIRTAWARLSGEGADRAIVQQYLDGEIFATAAVCDRGHRTIARTTIKKVAICSRGSTWSAVNVPNGVLEESFAAFLKHIRWTGPAEAEFIRDRLTDRFYLIEINPRFTAWIGYTATLGSNHPLLTALVALNRQTSAATDDGAAVFMRSSIEVPVGPGGFAAFSTRGALIHD
jgi:carbamoyl-phosphate synthase large subunit